MSWRTDIEVAGPKLKSESTFFGFINLPRVPMLKIHKYILLILGAAVVTWDVARQLPPDLSKLDEVNLDDQGIWMALPFLIAAYLFSNKDIYIRVCRQFRLLALQQKKEISEHELEFMVESAMVKLLPMRIFDVVYLMLTWFVLFNLMLFIVIQFWK